MAEDAPIEIPASSQVLNPIQAAVTVLAGFAGGYFVKAGLLTQEQLSVVIPAVLTLAYAGFRAFISWKRATRAVTMARNADDSVAVVK